MVIRKSHHVVIQKSDASIGIYPLKQWLRDNPQHLLDGMSADDKTSHSLRSALKKSGWVLHEGSEQVLLIKPDENGDISYADELLEDSALEDREYDDEIDELSTITFGLERDLQLALRINIEQLGPDLKIIDGGKEKVTEAGRIDITAIDADDKVVVIELKAGTATDRVIAQILAYMGTVTDEFDNKQVRGILVAGDFPKRVVLAARAIPNLQLMKYSFQFTFDVVS